MSLCDSNVIFSSFLCNYKVLRELYRLQRTGVLKFTLKTPAIAVQVKPSDWLRSTPPSSPSSSSSSSSYHTIVNHHPVDIETLSLFVYYLLYAAERCSQNKVKLMFFISIFCLLFTYTHVFYFLLYVLVYLNVSLIYWFHFILVFKYISLHKGDISS